MKTTDRDLHAARQATSAPDIGVMYGRDALNERVANAIAAERERAREAFLAVAVALDGAAITAQSKDHRAFVPGTGATRAKALREAADRIRKVADA